MRIEKKTWPSLFRHLVSGKKSFDLRLADFACKPGDVLVFREWDPLKKRYTGRKLKTKVNYVMKTKKLKFWSKSDIEKYGFQIIGFDAGNRK